MLTNALDEDYWTFVSGVFAAGFEARTLGQPRMAGVRLRYDFGD